MTSRGCREFDKSLKRLTIPNYHDGVMIGSRPRDALALQLKKPRHPKTARLSMSPDDPPLLASFKHSLPRCLNARDGFAIAVSVPAEDATLIYLAWL
jgi:hypothetical protein